MESEHKGQSTMKVQEHIQILQTFCNDNDNFPFQHPQLNCKANADHTVELAKLLALDVLEKLTFCQMESETKSQKRDTLQPIIGNRQVNDVWTLSFKTKCVQIGLHLKFKLDTHPYELETLSHSVDGKRPTIYIASAYKLEPEGIDCGSYVFSTYFSALMKNGVLALVADRTYPKTKTDKPLVGYNVWPRYGFDALLKKEHVELLTKAMLEVTGSEAASSWIQKQENGLRFSTIFGYFKDEEQSVAEIKNMIKEAWKDKGVSVWLYFDATEQGEHFGPVSTLKRAIRDREQYFSEKCPAKLE